MFSLAMPHIADRRILVVETEEEILMAMRSAIAVKGGIALGPASSVDEALCYIATMGHVDCVMLDTRLATATSRPVADLFKDCRVETIFVIGHDDWFDEDADEFEDVGAIGWRLPAIA